MREKQFHRRKSRKQEPTFGCGFLADAILQTESGKIDAHGVINVFWAWSYPCYRGAHALVTIFNLPKALQKVETFLQKKGTVSKKLISVAVAKEVKRDVFKGTSVAVIPVPLRFQLDSDGDYEIIGRIRGYRSTLRIPFVVNTKPWPSFTTKELDYIRTNPSLLPQIRTAIECEKCKTPYVFQEFLIEVSELPKNVHPFPDSGEFKCEKEKCGALIPLKDVQGQIRDSLKKRISELLSGKP